MKPRLGILLTATVSVQVKGGVFADRERFEMYSDTLRYYAKTIGKDYPVVVVENSGYDLSAWREEFKDSLDLYIFQFVPGEPSYCGFDATKGKGYNEYLMIRKAVSDFPTTAGLEEMTHFLKITGRYSMLNIRSIIKEFERRASKREIEFWGDIKDSKLKALFVKWPMASQWGDSRFFIASVKSWNAGLGDIYKEMYDYEWGYHAESIILNLSRAERKNPKYIHRFRTQVIFNGKSGVASSLEAGAEAQNSKSNLRKARRRQWMRWLLPFIWA